MFSDRAFVTTRFCIQSEVNQLHAKYHIGVGRDGATPGRSVSEVGRDDEYSFFPFLHGEQGLVPTLDHPSLSDWEINGGAAVDGRIKLGAVE